VYSGKLFDVQKWRFKKPHVATFLPFAWRKKERKLFCRHKGDNYVTKMKEEKTKM
jgi:hypothetical protein